MDKVQKNWGEMSAFLFNKKGFVIIFYRICNILPELFLHWRNTKTLQLSKGQLCNYFQFLVSIKIIFPIFRDPENKHLLYST
jgi:hypothetical protein